MIAYIIFIMYIDEKYIMMSLHFKRYKKITYFFDLFDFVLYLSYFFLLLIQKCVKIS